MRHSGHSLNGVTRLMGSLCNSSSLGPSKHAACCWHLVAPAKLLQRRLHGQLPWSVLYIIGLGNGLWPLLRGVRWDGMGGGLHDIRVASWGSSHSCALLWLLLVRLLE
jgi:hypothetical protein